MNGAIEQTLIPHPLPIAPTTKTQYDTPTSISTTHIHDNFATHTHTSATPRHTNDKMMTNVNNNAALVPAQTGQLVPSEVHNPAVQYKCGDCGFKVR